MSFDYTDCLWISYPTEGNNSPPDSHGAFSNSAISRGIDLWPITPNLTGRQNGQTKPWSNTCESIATTNKTTGATSSPMPHSCTTTPRTRRPNSLPSSLIRVTTRDISCQFTHPLIQLIPPLNTLLNSSVNSTEYSTTTCNAPRPSTKRSEERRVGKE